MPKDIQVEAKHAPPEFDGKAVKNKNSPEVTSRAVFM